MDKILVWDVPTCIGHWLLVITFILSFITGDSEEQRLFHVAAGYAVGGVIVFRIFRAERERVMHALHHFYSPLARLLPILAH
ncbi:MAG: hypothetical protein Q8L62_12405 [Candidatus Nitrotoga sp.]|nr:hypothetical protein [Candidatus Nitrotoga sp.]